jgi:hypothetical protein
MIILYTIPHYSEFELFAHHLINKTHFQHGYDWTSFPRQVLSIKPQPGTRAIYDNSLTLSLIV